MRTQRYARWNGLLHSLVQAVREMYPEGFIGITRQRDCIIVELETHGGQRAQRMIPRPARYNFPIHAMRAVGKDLAWDANAAPVGEQVWGWRMTMAEYVEALGYRAHHWPKDLDEMITVYSNGRARSRLRDITPTNVEARRRIMALAR